MNFNDFANQMILKYRVAVAIAILKNKPEILSTHQYIEVLRNKFDVIEMDCDSDVTVCSDDFNLDDDVEICEGNREVEADLSVNLLEGFDFDKLVQENLGGKDLDRQLLDLFEERPPDGADEVSNVATQSTFCESVQSQNLINELELIQSSLTFCESERVDDKTDSDKANNVTRGLITNISINNNNNTDRPIDSIQTALTNTDSQKTQLYDIDGMCEEYTHVNDSQSNCLKIKTNHLYNKSKLSNDSKDKKLSNNPKIHDQFRHSDDNVHEDDTEALSSETRDKYAEKDSCKLIDPNNSLVFDDFNKIKSNDIVKTNHKDANEVDTKFNFTASLPILDNFGNKNEFERNNTYETDSPDKYLDVHESQTEIIRFKVIEELNRVKSYLHRKDNRMNTDESDSGYRTDLLSRSSNKSLYSSDAWINQSAHCLLKFLQESPVVVKTRDISEEISRTLGRLIDKLYEEEKYPSFLEDMMDTVEKLLRNIHEGDSYVEDVILRKDIDIHRLFHLNRSHHIIKYTIDKITLILENFLTGLTDDGTLELTDTVQMENLCYIFHILGYLIKRLAATRDNLSQNSTQTTQDDDRLKRSSLTDVWRKKWNPNYKSESQQSNPQTKCAETKCSEILNKIIVKSMDGYGLISFAALQCYNLLQT